jgi:glycosyltransferase involved in cell wall biosynthesis
MPNQNQTEIVDLRVLQLICSNALEADHRDAEERFLLLLLKALHCATAPAIRITVATFSRVEGRFDLICRSFPPDHFSVQADRPFRGNDLWQLVKENDVVHIHQPCSEAGTIGVLVANQSFRRVVITFTEKEKSDSLLIKWSGLSLVDRAICFSEHSAKRLKLLGGVDRIDVIHGPVDTEVFVKSTLRPQKNRQILCRGPITRDSGIDLVIKALPTSLNLIVCGPIYEIDYPQHLEALAKGKSVTFVPNVSDKELRELYEQSLVTVAAYRYDGMQNRSEDLGRSLLESMSVGTPVVCSRIGALPEYLPGAEAGLTFDDPEQLAFILERVASGEWPGEGASLACVDHVRNNSSLSFVGQKLVSLYGELSRRVSGENSRRH